MIETASPAAALKGVHQGYRRRRVLTGLDFELGAGVTALVGPNGAGKTTLINTLATLMRPKRGCVEVLGQPVRSRAALREARAHLGYLPQDFGADPRFTVTDLVTYAAWLRGLPGGTLDAQVREAVATVELSDRAGTRFRALSGGMRQRAGIACAIVGGPAVVILDEPTVGLDPEQRLGFRELLRNLGTTAVLLSTHLIEDVAAVADRVVLLDAGEVRFDGTVSELRMTADGAQGMSQLEAAYVQVLRSRP